jgi:hypothetical protein
MHGTLGRTWVVRAKKVCRSDLCGEAKPPVDTIDEVPEVVQDTIRSKVEWSEGARDGRNGSVYPFIDCDIECHGEREPKKSGDTVEAEACPCPSKPRGTVVLTVHARVAKERTCLKDISDKLRHGGPDKAKCPFVDEKIIRDHANADAEEAHDSTWCDDFLRLEILSMETFHDRLIITCIK